MGDQILQVLARAVNAKVAESRENNTCLRRRTGLVRAR
jgi:hypothetical protein